MILAIDTTHEFGGIALLDNGELLDEVLLHAPDGFGQVLFGYLSQTLARHSVAIEQIDCFAATSGPGSFTGVRVGLACIKGLAEAAGKPVVAVSNLQALAAFGTAKARATVIDARRGEIYGAVYDSSFRLILAEAVMNFPAWLDTLPTGDLEFISTDFSPFRETLSGTRFAGARIIESPRALAGAVAKIAQLQFDAGRAVDPAEIDANYVRRSDAELLWRDGSA